MKQKWNFVLIAFIIIFKFEFILAGQISLYSWRMHTYTLWVMCCLVNRHKWGNARTFLAQSTCWSPGTLLLLRCQRKLEPGFCVWSQVFYTSGIRGISYVRMQDFLSDRHLRNLMNNKLDSSRIFLFEMVILPLGKKSQNMFQFWLFILHYS